MICLKRLYYSYFDYFCDESVSINKNVCIMSNEESNMNDKYKLWFKRMGVVGFLFFLIKGLLWVAFFMGFKECLFK
jgi:hypothetical protein